MKSNKVSKHDYAYPSSLKELSQVPESLYYRGDFLTLLDKPRVAIVGSRKVTPYGRHVASILAADLAKAGVVVVSGLALGIDSIAHSSAIDAGGTTIAVLPCGIDTVYPAGHLGLAKRIIATGGALVSEYPGLEKPQKYQFIARNRIIAALSEGVVIPEAAMKSGSLHTAEFALEQGMEVFAVPGNITSSTSEGTNNLIKAGATPVTCAQDILEALNITAHAFVTTPSNVSPDEAKILGLLQEGIKRSDELLLMSKLGPDHFQMALTTLELAGAITSTAPGAWDLK